MKLYFSQRPSLYAPICFLYLSSCHVFLRSARQQTSKADALLPAAIQGISKHIPKNTGLEVAAALVRQVRHGFICVISPPSLFFSVSICVFFLLAMIDRYIRTVVLCHTVPYLSVWRRTGPDRGATAESSSAFAIFLKVISVPRCGRCHLIWGPSIMFDLICFCSLQINIPATAGYSFEQFTYEAIQ